jgi:hypothetical protein
MSIDADRFAQQVKLAYDFTETLHGQALALIKDVETQLEQAPESLQCLRAGGYRFVASRQSSSLENPQPSIATYYTVCFWHYSGRIRNTPLKGELPPMPFLKVTLRERNLADPEVRFGLITQVVKAAGRDEGQWPTKLEDLVAHLADRALGSPIWATESSVDRHFEDSYVSVRILGAGVKLAALPDSEAIADQIVDPLLAMYRQAMISSSET